MSFDMEPEDLDPHGQRRHEIRKLTEKVVRLQTLVDQVDQMLHIPAAEYVPAIVDVFELIDQFRGWSRENP